MDRSDEARERDVRRQLDVRRGQPDVVRQRRGLRLRRRRLRPEHGHRWQHLHLRGLEVIGRRPDRHHVLGQQLRQLPDPLQSE